MKKNIFKIVAVAITLIVGATIIPSGNVYYVSPSGNDSNPCSQILPCKTINRTINSSSSGDKIIVLDGQYNEMVIISKSGIVLEGQNAIINTSYQNAIKISSTAKNIEVRGFEITGTRSHSILIEGSFVTIENNEVYHSILENGTLINGVISCGNANWGSGIKAERGSSDIIIRKNTVYENCGEGIASTMSNNVLIEENSVWDNKQVNIYIDNSFNVKVIKNHSYCAGKLNSPNAISLGEEFYSGWGAQLRDIEITSNIIDGCNNGIMVFDSYVGGTLKNVLIDSNIVSSGKSFAISVDHSKCSNLVISNNRIWKTSIWTRCSGGVLSNNTFINYLTPFLTQLSTVEATKQKTSTPTTFYSSTPNPTISKVPNTLTLISTITKTYTPTFTSTYTSTPTPTCLTQYPVHVGNKFIGNFCP